MGSGGVVKTLMSHPAPSCSVATAPWSFAGVLYPPNSIFRCARRVAGLSSLPSLSSLSSLTWLPLLPTLVLPLLPHGTVMAGLVWRRWSAGQNGHRGHGTHQNSDRGRWWLPLTPSFHHSIVPSCHHAILSSYKYVSCHKDARGRR